MVSTLLRLSEPLPAAASTGAKQYSTTNSYDSNKVISVQASDFGQFCSSNKDDLLVAHATNTDAMPVYWNRHTPFVHNSEKSISENIRTYLLMPVQEAMNALKESIFGDTGANLSVVIVPQAPATVLKADGEYVTNYADHILVLTRADQREPIATLLIVEQKGPKFLSTAIEWSPDRLDSQKRNGTSQRTKVLHQMHKYVDALKCDICLLTDYDRLKLFKFHTPDNLKKISAELFAFSAFGKSRDSPLYIVAAATFSNLLQTLGRLGLRPSSARTAPAPSNPYPGQSSRSKRTLAQPNQTAPFYSASLASAPWPPPSGGYSMPPPNLQSFESASMAALLAPDFNSGNLGQPNSYGQIPPRLQYASNLDRGDYTRALSYTGYYPQQDSNQYQRQNNQDQDEQYQDQSPYQGRQEPPQYMEQRGTYDGFPGRAGPSTDNFFRAPPPPPQSYATGYQDYGAGYQMGSSGQRSTPSTSNSGNPNYTSLPDYTSPFYRSGT